MSTISYKFSSLILITIAALTLQGCLSSTESDFDKQVREADEALENYIASHGVQVEKHSSGVYIEMVEENNGGRAILDNHVVGITYTMKLLKNESVIETNSDTTNPLRFSNSYSYNNNSLHPAGLNYEIEELRLGETARFYIPNYQAYGSYTHDDLFPAYSNFIVEVTVVEVKTEEQIYEEELTEIQNYLGDTNAEMQSYPNGLYYQEVEAGDGAQPEDGSVVDFHFTRKYLDGSVIETTEGGDPEQRLIGSNLLVDGLNMGLKLMHEGEKATFIMPSKLAFGKSVQMIPQQLREDLVENDALETRTKPYSPVIYEVELVTVN